MTDVMKVRSWKPRPFVDRFTAVEFFNGVAFYPARFLPKKASFVSSIKQAQVPILCIFCKKLAEGASWGQIVRMRRAQEGSISYIRASRYPF